MNHPHTVTILGAGYVGLTTAVLLALTDTIVYLVEPNSKRLDVIKSGKSFFFEEGIDALITEGLRRGTLIPTDSYELGVPTSDVVFSCVGTPDRPDGSSNLNYVFGAAEQAIAQMKSGAIYVQKSTVPVGTGADITARYIDTSSTPIHYVSNPEFLREGTAVRDTLYFDRVVVGGSDTEANQTVLSLYKHLEERRDDIAAIAVLTSNEKQGSYVETSLPSAELIKVTANAFLALKISFANSIAQLADKTGADVVEVMDGVGADTRIGRAFLNAGRGYGGGCFPKDVSGLISSAHSHDITLGILTEAQRVNESMPDYVIKKLARALSHNLSDTTIAVLGLSFKAGTSDVRKSPGIQVANQLTHAGARVHAYDPKAADEASESLDESVRLFDTLAKAIGEADGVIIATEWPEFLEYEASLYYDHIGEAPFVDAVNQYDKAKAIAAGLTYIGVGR